MKSVFIVIALFLIPFCSSSFAQASRMTSLPDCHLMVAAREKEDGKPKATIYIFKLDCQGGQCTLTTQKINSCFDSVMSFPDVWRSSTSEGTLSVNIRGNHFEVSETLTDAVGSTKSNFLFGYSFNDKLKFAGKVRSFTGGSVYSLTNLSQVKISEYIPFVGENVKVMLDCSTVLLPGVEAEK